ncbi:MAG: hypothetical protein H6Q67_2161 [Firmicutes bacterium]|nr:hypothetical protein [Bacillota bacterium]
MSAVSAIIYRLRLKLKDMDAVNYSKYEIQDALDETLSEMNTLVKQYYGHLTFMDQDNENIPLDEGERVVDADGEVEFEKTGFPDEFNNLIIDYAIILLSPGDYATKEQVKQLWQQKVLSLGSTFNNDNNLLDGCYGPISRRYWHKKRGHDSTIHLDKHE